jgi:DNA polymerase-3 subunit delta'
MWHGIEGHDAIVERFRRGLARGRLASTFLFVGREGIGKRSFALKLAQALLCQARPEAALDPCGACRGCVQSAAGTHPDLIRVARPAERSVLPLELLIGPPERRMQEGLCHAISLKPFMGGRRVAIIEDADYLADEGANALLKTLEEPPPRSLLVLIGSSADRQLPTIRSRCQVVRFAPLPAETVARLLVERGVVADEAQARRAARFSEGSLTRASALVDAGLWDFRRGLLDALAQGAFDARPLAAEVTGFVEAAGREAPPRRDRLRLTIGLAADFYRQLARAACGAAAGTDDEELAAAVGRALPVWNGGFETAAACAHRCLEGIADVDRNAHQAAVIECWLDDLAQVAAGRGAALVSELAARGD